jgi:GT2 family glycosyltransferase
VKEQINVVIVTYNNKELLDKCISSVQISLKIAELNGRITVVDNNSNDGTEVSMKNKFTSVHYIRNSENYGTAKAFNRGIQEGGDIEYTFLMNDDVELFPETIKEMMTTLHRYPQARGIPANLIYADGSSQRIKLKLVGLTKLRDNKIRLVRFPGTTACLYYTQVFQIVGLFDEFYFFYNEDLDFALSAKRKKLIFVFNPIVKVIHHKAKGRVKGERYVKPHAFSSDYYFYRKNYGFTAATLYLMVTKMRLPLYKRKYKKRKDTKQLEFLEMGIKKLHETVLRFRYGGGSSNFKS